MTTEIKRGPDTFRGPQAFHKGDIVRVVDGYSTMCDGAGVPDISPYAGQRAEVIGSYVDVIDPAIVSGLASAKDVRHQYKLRFFEEHSGYEDTEGVSWFEETALTLER